MNILIVGNGFDLSHYLPTKYDHFMDVMQSIEEKDLFKYAKGVVNNPIDHPLMLLKKYFEVQQALDEKSYQMNFNQLFFNTRDKGFINKTKEFYNTDEIKINFLKIIEIKEKLKNNSWYQYFSAHVKDIKTWIDFETKIEDVLVVFTQCIADIERLSLENKLHLYFMQNNQDEKSINPRYSKILNFFQFTAEEKYEYYAHPISLYNQERKKHSQNRTNINAKFCYGQNIENGFNAGSFLSYLNDQLEDFIELFNFYLEEVVKKLKPKSAFQPLKSDNYDLMEIAHIYSFNYTQTYLDFYNSKTEISFLHGRSGEDQNMVLGISELKDDVLKKIKAYGFTKYHQKLMKNTNYGFLNHNEEFDNLVNPSGMREGEIIQINIWGHSLDVSDEDYIQEIFSFNGNEDQYVRVTVFYFDTSAKFSLLANLLHILGKGKVEHWMKQGWLKFEPNPDVAQLNQIQPVKLP